MNHALNLHASIQNNGAHAVIHFHAQQLIGCLIKEFRVEPRLEYDIIILQERWLRTHPVIGA